MKKLLSFLLLTISFQTLAQQTYVPDDNFEAWLEMSGMGNGISNDDSVTTSNISGQTGIIAVSLGIVDITGIEDFTSLTQIIFDSNPITSADLSQNLALTYAGFNACALTSMNVSQNSQLQTLICSNSSLVSLDLTGNPLLEVLNCTGNDLLSLNVTQNTALTSLLCSQNPVTSLDVTQNVALEELSCVQCALASLDLTQNTALTTLDCRSNSLTALDVSQNTALTTLFCRANSLTTLDLTLNLNLNNLNCTFNDLQCLRANNQNTFENPGNPGTYTFVCVGNANLTCIEVSDPALASANYNADAGATFNLACPPVVDVSVTQSGTLLTADLSSAIYQWVDCDDNNSDIVGATNQSFTPTFTGNFAVSITVSDACGSTATETSSCFLVDYTGLEELVNNEKELVKIIDFTGRETEFKSNIPLIFIYSDGSRERVMEIQY